MTVNSFLASGGDNFGELANGTNKRDTGQVDLQAMVDYMADEDPGLGRTSPNDRSASTFPAGAPAEYRAGDTVAFALSSLAIVDGCRHEGHLGVGQGRRRAGG